MWLAACSQQLLGDEVGGTVPTLVVLERIANALGATLTVSVTDSSNVA